MVALNSKENEIQNAFGFTMHDLITLQL